jgi:hypothetical protein
MRLVPSLLLLLCTSGFAYGDVANMSGIWTLNVKRSDWGKKPPPTRVDLVIEHNEPSFRYSGTAQPPDERGPSKFEFTGAIDNKEYIVTEDTGKRKARFRRTSDNSVEGVYLDMDGKVQETTTTTVLRDGKTMVRQVRIKLPDGRMSTWSEVYEKAK